MSYLAVEQELYISTCPNCGCIFGMPRFLETKRREDGESFYCPSGHSMHFGSENAKLKEKLAAKERELELKNRRLSEEIARAEEEKRKRQRSEKSLKRNKLRIANGVCTHCHRTFSDLADHMKTCHSEEIPNPRKEASKIDKTINERAKSAVV